MYPPEVRSARCNYVLHHEYKKRFYVVAVLQNSFFSITSDQQSLLFPRRIEWFFFVIDMKRFRQKILIVDDSRLFLNRLVLLLMESGSTNEIITVEDYEEALAQLIKSKPDIVFLDIHLRNRCGIDLLKVIRLSGWDCKVIMLTNETKEAYRQQCEQLGPVLYLDKSHDFEEIPELLKAL